MRKFKVLGSGCRNCATTAARIAQVAAEVGVEIELEKVTDLAAIMRHGVMSTPGVVLDGAVVHAGSVPSVEQIRDWLQGEA